MSAPAAIKQADMERILKAAKAADIPVRVEFSAGKVVVTTLREGESQLPETDRFE